MQVNKRVTFWDLDRISSTIFAFNKSLCFCFKKKEAFYIQRRRSICNEVIYRKYNRSPFIEGSGHFCRSYRR